MTLSYRISSKHSKPERLKLARGVSAFTATHVPVPSPSPNALPVPAPSPLTFPPTSTLASRREKPVSAFSAVATRARSRSRAPWPTRPRRRSSTCRQCSSTDSSSARLSRSAQCVANPSALSESARLPLSPHRLRRATSRAQCSLAHDPPTARGPCR